MNAPKRLRVLVADDDHDTAEVLRECLCDAGHAVVCVGVATAVLEAMGSGDFDVVLLDLTMPGLSTVDLVTSVSRLPRRPPIVVFSARLPGEVRAFAQRMGAAAVLPKPCELDVLLRAVRAAATTNPAGAFALGPPTAGSG